jgi:hypothetical protein
MTRSRGAILLVLAACGLRVYDFEATDGASSSASLTSEGSPTSTSSSATALPTTTGTIDATSTGSTGSTGHVFINPVDGGTGTKECDLFTQGCPEGQKCMPASLDGDNSWETLICVPLAPNPAGLYQPCTTDGVSGVDTCDIQLMCWSVDPDTGTGTCFGQCTGSPGAPTCADIDAQSTFGRSDIAFCVCLPHCSVLLQDCPGTDLCLPNPMSPTHFMCVIDASGEEGQAFDPCEYANACDPGLFCGNPEFAKECDIQSPGCCLPFCNLTVFPANCPGAGLQCLPFYEEGQAPPGDENVGVCGLPP